MAYHIDRHIGAVVLAPLAAGAAVRESDPRAAVVASLKYAGGAEGNAQPASFAPASKYVHFAPGLPVCYRFLSRGR